MRTRKPARPRPAPWKRVDDHAQTGRLDTDRPSESAIGPIVGTMTDPDTAKRPGPILYDRKARWSDCDAQGIVYNPTYLIYWDDAFSDYMDAIGLPWNEMTARGDDVVLARAEIDYRSSGRMGQIIRTSARVVKIGRSSITFEYRSVDATNGDLLAEGTQIQVIVDHDTMRPKRVPDYLRAMIAHQEGWSA